MRLRPTSSSPPRSSSRRTPSPNGPTSVSIASSSSRTAIVTSPSWWSRSRIASSASCRSSSVSIVRLRRTPTPPSTRCATLKYSRSRGIVSVISSVTVSGPTSVKRLPARRRFVASCGAARNDARADDDVALIDDCCLARSDDNGVRLRIGADGVERLSRGHAQTAPLPRREPPKTLVRAESGAVLVDDGSLAGLETVPTQERAVIVAPEKARLLALGPPRDAQARLLGLGPRLVLRLLAEREPDALEHARVEPREHVRLILVGVHSAREQETAVMLDDASVVPCREPRRARTPRERQQAGEAEAAVAPRARVRRRPLRIATHERLDDRLPEVLAGVDRHVRHAERMTGLAGGDDGFRRAAGALRTGRLRVDPKPERDPDGVRAGLEQGDRAVDATTHRDGDAGRIGHRTEDRADGCGERIECQRIARHGGRLEQRQTGERALQPVDVGVDDPVAVDAKVRAGPLAAARCVACHLQHEIRLAEPATGRSFRARVSTCSTLCVASRTPCRTNKSAKGVCVRQGLRAGSARHPPGTSRFASCRGITGGVEHKMSPATGRRLAENASHFRRLKALFLACRPSDARVVRAIRQARSYRSAVTLL